jgi:myo-inositol-1(or 4)-monophosphatase
VSEEPGASRAGPALPAAVLAELERTAVELARLAGAEIVTALGRTLAVRYKKEAAGALPTDPVSEVDHRVEVLIRARLGERFPEHEIIGEEIDLRPEGEHEFAWVVDPIDGTANFVNGFPLFAASIGVLHRGAPVVGAIWCATSHALRAGVYHAHRGGPLRFDDEPLALRRRPALRRRLAGEPGTPGASTAPWDVRVTGSAALECAFVAAGLLRVARFERPNVWDVGAGLVLVRAAGGAIRVRGAAGWEPFERCENPRDWRRSLILGEPAAVELLCRAQP